MLALLLRIRAIIQSKPCLSMMCGEMWIGRHNLVHSGDCKRGVHPKKPGSDTAEKRRRLEPGIWIHFLLYHMKEEEMESTRQLIISVIQSVAVGEEDSWSVAKISEDLEKTEERISYRLRRFLVLWQNALQSLIQKY